MIKPTYLLVALCVATTVQVASASSTLFHISREKELLYTAKKINSMPVTYGTVMQKGKVLKYGSPYIRMTIHTGPSNDMLSYRIQGLRNPTIVVPQGATLDITFVNDDDDMFHNIRFGTMPAHVTSGLSSKLGVGSPELAHNKKGMFHVERMLMHSPANPGSFAYFCTVKGHASGGMHGVFIVK